MGLIDRGHYLAADAAALWIPDIFFGTLGDNSWDTRKYNYLQGTDRTAVSALRSPVPCSVRIPYDYSVAQSRGGTRSISHKKGR